MTLVRHFLNILLVLVLIGSILANRFAQQTGIQVNVTNASSQEPIVIKQSPGDDSMMESLQDKLIRACVNPQFRNTPLGQQTCQNYTESTNQTVDLTPNNCSLVYWDCCESSFQNNEGQNETIKTCTWINKCETFYAVSTCVTPSTCNKTCNNNNSTLNLFNDSLRGNAPNDIQGLIQMNSIQGVLNLAQKDMVRNTQCVGSPIGKDEGLQTNCCTGCETQYYTLNGQLLLYYNLPDFNKTDLSPILLAANVSSTFHHTVLHDKYMYLFNTCQDPRVENLFGINQNNQLRYELMCRNLAYDWGQYFAPYQCNQWLCNNQGTCNFTTLPTGTVSPTCTCNNGYRGWNCMFNSTTYDYISSYMNGLDTWVNNFERILDEETLIAFTRIVNHIMNFVAYADPADRDKYAKTVDKYWSLVGSADYVNITDDLLRGIGLFADSLLYTDSVSGLNPNATRAALSKFNNQQPTTLGFQQVINTQTPNNSSNTESQSNQTNTNSTLLQNQPNNTSGNTTNGTNQSGSQLQNNTNVTVVSGQGGRLRRRFLIYRNMQDQQNSNNTTTGLNETGGGHMNNTLSSNETQNNLTTSNTTDTSAQQPNASNQTEGGETGNATETQPKNQTSGGGTGNITQPLVNVTVINTTTPTNQTQPQEGNATQLGNETTNEPQGPMVSNQGGQGKINLIEGRRNPKVTIPANVTSQLPNNTVYALFVVRNPRTFLSPNDTFIYSQIVHVFAFPDYLSHEGVDTSNRTNNTLAIVPNTNNTNHTNPAASQQGGTRLLQQTQNTTNETNNNTNDNNTGGQAGNQQSENNTEAAGNNTGGDQPANNNTATDGNQPADNNTIVNITVVNNTAAGTGENNTNQTSAQPAENNTAPTGNETAANNQNQTASPPSEGNNTTQPINETGNNNTKQNQPAQNITSPETNNTGGNNNTRPIQNITIIVQSKALNMNNTEETSNNQTSNVSQPQVNNMSQLNQNNTIFINTSLGTQSIPNEPNAIIIVQSEPNKEKTIILNGTTDANITIVVRANNNTSENSNDNTTNSNNTNNTSQNNNQTNGNKRQLLESHESNSSWDQIEYPSNTSNITINIPWTYVPLKTNESYVENCKVYSFDGYHWVQETNCSVDQTSDSYQAVIVCNKFGLFGVSCNGVIPYNATIGSNNSNTPIIATGGGSLSLRTIPISNTSENIVSKMSVFFLLFIGFILI